MRTGLMRRFGILLPTGGLALWLCVAGSVLGLIAPALSFAQAPFTCSVANGCVFPPQRDRWLVYSVGGAFNYTYYPSKEAACAAFAASQGYTLSQMILSPIFSDELWWWCNFPVGGGAMLAHGISCPIFADEVDNSTGSLTIELGQRLLGCCTANQRLVPQTWPTSLWYGDVTAQCTVRDPPVPERHSGAPATCAGNPIDIAVGTKYQREVDMTRHATLLQMQRVYQSGPIGTLFTRPFSDGWQHGFGQRIAASATTAQAIRPDGRVVQFAWSGAQWLSWPDETTRLSEQQDMHGHRTGWLLTLPSNESEVYDAAGRILHLHRSDGRRLAFIYTDGTLLPPSGAQVLDAAGVPASPPRPVPAGTLLRVAEEFGRVVEFGYDTSNRLVQVVDVGGAKLHYLYDSENRLAEVLYPDSTPGSDADNPRRRYHYEHPNYPAYLTGITDENGVRYATFDYTPSGQVVGTRHVAGSTPVNNYTVSYAPWGTAGTTSTTSRTIIDPLGTQTTQYYQVIVGKARLTSQDQPGGAGCGPASSSITYDSNANVASRTDFNGTKTCYANDLSRNLETKRVDGLASGADCAASLASPPIGAAVRVVSTAWHPDWRLETGRAEPGRITTWVYNGHGASCAPADALVDSLPIAVVCQRREQATADTTGAAGFSADAVGAPRVWTSTYNRWGQMLTARGPRTDVDDTMAYTYSATTTADWTMGDLASITNAAGHVTRFTKYNPHGQVLERIDPNGLVTTFTYDLRQRLTAQQVGTERTVYTYDPVGNLTAVTLPDGAELTYTYDAAHRLIGVADRLGNTFTYTLDAMGNRVGEEVRDPGGQLTHSLTRVYDALNRLQQLTGDAAY